MSKTFIVTGRLPFPLDMLRYDACWPVSTDDAFKIAESLDRSVDGSVSITLCTNAKSAPTVGRWNSFSWSVKS